MDAPDAGGTGDRAVNRQRVPSRRTLRDYLLDALRRTPLPRGRADLRPGHGLLRRTRHRPLRELFACRARRCLGETWPLGRVRLHDSHDARGAIDVPGKPYPAAVLPGESNGASRTTWVLAASGRGDALSRRS